MSSVSCIDNTGGAPLGQLVWSASRRVANHNNVWRHGLQVPDSIDQSFPFGNTTGRDRYIDSVSAEPLGGNLEGRACSCRSLEEKIDDGFPAERGDFLDGPF